MKKISRQEAEQAVKTLIKWAGADPEQGELINTPARVVKSYEEFFAGYQQSSEVILSKKYNAISNNEIVILKDIKFTSYCEHHMLPIIGSVSIAYLPNQYIVGISKLARIVDLYARRLQLQERLTVQIAEAIYKQLEAKGVGVVVEASHHCMVTRGVQKAGATMKTNCLLGEFNNNNDIKQEFYNLICN